MNDKTMKDSKAIDSEIAYEAPVQYADFQLGELKEDGSGYDAVFGKLTEDGPNYRSVRCSDFDLHPKSPFILIFMPRSEGPGLLL